MTDDIAHTELIAVLVAITREQPRVMTVRQGYALPSGPFETEHRSLQMGLRAWVQAETAHPVGYLEQLYTFADRDRHAQGERIISISYLGLVRENQATVEQAGWCGWYDYLPWEDHRGGVPEILGPLSDGLHGWAHQAASAGTREQRLRRIAFAFGLNGERWNEDLTLQRYELLYEAGLVREAGRGDEGNGLHMFADHRRILATAIARLRGKIKYRPVIFELMPESFTLLQLQRSIEALAGLRLHKQNFRRLVEQQDLVEETGESDSETGGRPAKLFRFRYSIVEERALSERHLAGAKLPVSRIDRG
ncbi:hypothetical protein DKP76_12295 [Falsochrobactrum shanghaiense]|uniref:NrtR DNA-binding winged helix domain-containing protein n=1 Tax=Falsochrobactrum shanghaiense TaxID=2201899 RepID=A0A316J9U7_9HYPH|nr:hypothetical protein [Falsochrobactrum shanghaiense]PWL17539.1 hypothetical protein DKP76_12295 [Falsochrobactrum shanghaiense]